MGSHNDLDICARCGRVRRIHGTGLAGCADFTPAEDDVCAADATEAARAAGERRERAYKQLRRAVANWRLDEARRLLDELMEAER